MLVISDYLQAICQIVIDEYNSMFANVGTESIRRIAHEQSSKNDLTFRIGSPFRQLAHFTIADPNDGVRSTANHDIDILFADARRYKIEVKYLKNWSSASGQRTNSKNWTQFYKDFQWLDNEITRGNKNCRAFVIGWFNCLDYFSQSIQLGETSGRNPRMSSEKLCFFPFLIDSEGRQIARDYKYNYDNAYRVLDVNTNDGLEMNCIFLGNESDKYHVAIYF